MLIKYNALLYMNKNTYHIYAVRKPFKDCQLIHSYKICC